MDSVKTRVLEVPGPQDTRGARTLGYQRCQKHQECQNTKDISDARSPGTTEMPLAPKTPRTHWTPERLETPAIPGTLGLTLVARFSVKMC